MNDQDVLIAAALRMHAESKQPGDWFDIASKLLAEMADSIDRPLDLRGSARPPEDTR